MSIGSLDTVTALSRPDLLAPGVAAALAAANGTLPADDIGVAEIDPELADTAAFCERYDVALSESANCVVVTGRRDRKSTRLNSSHEWISYAGLCLKKKT